MSRTRTSPIHLHAIVVTGGKVDIVPVIFEGGGKCTARHVTTTGAKDAALELKNSTAILGVSAKRPPKAILGQVYEDWNKRKEGNNAFLRENLIPNLWVKT